jgi:hypothetical protein
MTSCHVTINHVEEGLRQWKLSYFPSNISLKRKEKKARIPLVLNKGELLF